MSLASLSQKGTTGKGLAALAGIRPSKKLDLGTIEGLSQKVKEVGLGKEVAAITDTTPKLSFLQRLGEGLSALNPAQAILKGTEKGIGAGLLEYPTNIIKRVGSAITGKDYSGEDKYFSDVAEKLGVENGIAKFGIGFVGDVLLDPSTYFGGAIVKGIGATVKGAGGVALKGVGKVAPEVETGLRMAGTGLQDALGRAFQYGYKASRGATQDVLTFLSKEQRAKLGLASSNLDRLGTGVLTQSQREELALKMIAGKRAEFVVRESARKIALSSDEFLPISNKLDRMIETRGGYVSDIQKQINRLEKAGLKTKLAEKTTQKPQQLISGIKTKTVPDIVNFDVNDVPTGFGRQGYTKITDVPAISAIRGEQSTKSFIESLITDPNKDVLALKRQVATKENNLDSLFDEINDLKVEYQKIQDLKYKRLSLADTTYAEKGRVAREVAKSSDPTVQKAIEEQSARGKKFAEDIVQNPYETYFPFIKKDKLQKFLNESKGIKVGSEGYRKQFKNLLTNENLELDPAKAFFTRESQIVSDKMTRDFLSGFVEKYGKPLTAFKTSDEALAEGFHLIKEKGIFGKELGYVGEFDAKLIRDSISPEFQTVNMLAKATGFDVLTSLFKRSVTGLFAPFHVRNFASGQIQNFETFGIGALNPKNIAIGQKIAYLMGKGEKIPEGTIELGGKTMKFSQVMKSFVDRFSGDTFYNADFALALDSGAELKQMAGILSKQRLKETVKTVGLGTEAVPFKIGRAIGQYIEHQQKATAYITALGQGKAIKEALQLAENAGFDYRALTSFESQIMRRIIPFYTFTRKNIGLQLRTLGENPQRINQVIRFFSNVASAGGLTDEERQALPDYLKDQLVISFGKNKLGQPIVAGGFGTPIEQPGQAVFGKGFGDSIRRIATSVNSLIRAPLEEAFGRDFFQDRPLKEVVEAQQYQILPDFIKDFIGFTEYEKPVFKMVDGKWIDTGKKQTKFTADPEKLHFLRNLPTTRLFGYLYEIYRPEEETVAGARITNLLTGVKARPQDLKTIEYFQDKEKRDELEALLMRAGVLKEFTKIYEPKK